ncbi:hypothetical protein D3C80_918830 [compost metagenome]
MTIDGNAHTQLGQARIIMQLRVAVGHQHQRHAQVCGDLFQVLEVADADNAQGVSASVLVGHGAGDDFFGRNQRRVGAGNDRQLRVNPRLQRCTDLADAFGDADQVGGLAPELGRQQGVLDGQRGNPGTLKFGHRTHHVERVAIAVVGVGDHRQLGHPADPRRLLGEFAEADQGKVRGGQHLQGGYRAPEDTHLEAQIGGDTRRHRVEHGGGVVAGRGGKQLTERATQVLVGGSWHGLSRLSTSFSRSNITTGGYLTDSAARLRVSLGSSLNSLR